MIRSGWRHSLRLFLPERRKPFTRPLAAQCWYEMCRFGHAILLLSIAAPLLVLAAVSLISLFNPRWDEAPQAWLLALAVCPFVYQLIGAEGAIGLRRSQGATGLSAFDATATADARIAKAVRFIRQHACEGIDVGDVLKHVVISRTALDKRFLKALGHTPHEEIRRVRLKRARELLAETDLTIETIAERCGFRHGEYLGAVFLSQFGQTPGQYRAQERLRGDQLDPRLHIRAIAP